MTTARSSQICLSSTPWYHCTTRCVRRAFLFGRDAVTKRNFNHRKQWIEDRLLKLSEVFCIDIGAYAVMSNHYHVVLKIDIDRAEKLSDHDVIHRWSQIYTIPDIAKKQLDGHHLSEQEQKLIKPYLHKWRSELSNISRFMAEVNQNIARRANREDGCTGRFWEARFHSQAILDEAALLRTLIYVDLNPVRARVSNTPRTTKHTSAYRRLHTDTPALIPFSASVTQQKAVKSQTALQQDIATPLPISESDYMALLDWTAKCVTAGSNTTQAPQCFHAIGYSERQWIRTQRTRIHWHQKALGSITAIKAYCLNRERHWIWRSAEHEVDMAQS